MHSSRIVRSILVAFAISSMATIARADCSATAGMTATVEAQQWQRWQRTFISNSNYLPQINPWRDLDLTVTFTQCDAAKPITYTARGYWSGYDKDDQRNDKAFRIRGAFPAGIWQFVLSCRNHSTSGATQCSQDGALNTSGRFEVGTASSGLLYTNGFLRRAPGTAPSLVFDNNESFFWLGDTVWNANVLMDNVTAWPSLLNARKDDRTHKQFTVLQLAIAPWAALDTKNPSVKPFLKADGNPCPLANLQNQALVKCPRLDPVWWKDFDDKVQQANQNGMVVVLASFIDPISDTPADVMNDPTLMRSFAETVTARTLGNFVIFSPSFDHRPTVNSTIIETVGLGIQSVDLLSKQGAQRSIHLLTNHPAGATLIEEYLQSVHNRSWLNFELFQSGTPGNDTQELDNLTRRAVTLTNDLSTTSPLMPAINGESVYPGTGITEPNKLVNHTPYRARQTAYYSMLSGAQGYTMGICGVFNWDKPGIAHCLNWNLDHPAVKRTADSMKVLRSIVQSVPRRLKPQSESRVDGYAAASNDKKSVLGYDGNSAIVAYVPSDVPGIGISFSGIKDFDNPTQWPAKWVAIWINPRDGHTEPAARPNANSGIRQFTKPGGTADPSACEQYVEANVEKPSCNDWVLRITKNAATPQPNTTNRFIQAVNGAQDLRVTRQITDSAGNPVVADLAVDNAGFNSPGAPQIATEPLGNSMVVWQTENGTDTRILGRVLDNQGNPLPQSSEIVIAAGKNASPGHPAVAAVDGGFVVAWAGADPNRYGPWIRTRRYDRFGLLIPSSSDLAVLCSYVAGDYPQVVSAGSAGGYVIAWEMADGKGFYLMRVDGAGSSTSDASFNDTGAIEIIESLDVSQLPDITVGYGRYAENGNALAGGSGSKKVTLQAGACGGVPPLAVDDEFTVETGKALTIALREFLENDAPGVTFDWAHLDHKCVPDQIRGNCTYTAGAGNDTFTYTVTDAANHAASATARITVTQPQPLAANPDSFMMDSNTTLQVTSAQLLANDTPSNAVFVRVESPVNGSLSCAGNNPVTCTFTPSFPPKENASFQYVISRDGAAPFATGTVSITVKLVPFPRVFDKNGNLVSDFPSDPKEYVAKTPAMTALPITFTVKNNAPAGAATDLHLGVPITVSASPFSVVSPAKPYTASHQAPADIPIVSGPGDEAKFIIKFAASRKGTYSAVVGVPMSGGSATSPWSRTYQIHIKVQSGGKARVLQGATELANGGGFDADEPTQFTVENTSDTPLNLSNLAVPPHYSIVTSLPPPIPVGQSGTFALSKTGPPAGAGPFYVSFDVDDPDDPNFSVRENHKPVALNDSATVQPGSSVTVDVTANDTDPDGDGLSLAGVPVVVLPAKGTVAQDGDTLIYTPFPNASGTDRFTYEVIDGNGGFARADVIVTIVRPNQPPIAVDDSAATCRNTPVFIDVLANDSDPDHDPLTITNPSGPFHGTVLLNGTPSLRYSPDTGYTGPDSFQYDISDGFGGSAHATLTITVTPCGAPVARNDHATTKRDTPVTINLLENDHDPDNQAIWLTSNPIRVLPRHGTVDVLSSTSVRYTPEFHWGGNDVFQYQITDASGNKDTAWCAVHVGRTKSLPIAVDDTASTTANRAVTIDVLANDFSPDGDAITLTRHPFIANPWHGRVVRVSDSQVSYTPNVDWTGTDTFAYEISDSEYGTAVAFVTVTVTSENRPPVANPDSAATNAGVSVTIDVTANDTDPDGDPLTLVPSPIVTAPLHGSAARVSPSSIAYTPAAGYIGTDTFEYEISDGHGRTARGTVTITISNTNHPPEAADDDASTTAGVAVTIEVTANDSDVDNDQVSLITDPIVSPPSNGTAVKVNGSSITYTPRSGYTGTDRFQYEIGDHNGARARAWVDVTIGTSTTNRNPVAVDDDFTMLEATTKDFAVTVNDYDPDGDTVFLIVSPITFAPAHGTATRLSDTTIRYTPAVGYVGMDTLQYEINDGHGKRSRAWMRVMVRDANSRPEAVSDEASTTAGTPVTIRVTANDYDPDGDVVRLIAASSPIVTPPANGTATKVDADSIKYTPQAGFAGTDRFQYEITDGRGGHHRAWVNITVSGGSSANFRAAALSTSGVAPLAGNDAAEGLSDTSVDVVVLANDVSASGNSIVLSANPIVTPPLFGTAQRASNTTLTYTPSSAFRGNDRLEYEVVDSNGMTTTAWVTIQIPGDNKAPVAVDDVAAAAKDGSVTITPATNDTDENGDPLVLSVRAVVIAPQNGSVRRESDTQLVYSPSPGFLGDDSFVYEITDRRGGFAQGTVVVHVIGGAQPPVAINDSAAVPSGKAVAVNVVANDSDPDGDPVRVVASEPPQHGTIVWSGGTATYQANSGYVGPDSFRYTISDPTGLSAQGTVSITVAVTNTPTTAANDSVQTKTRTPVVIGVLANDWDPDPQRLTIASVTQPARGTVAISNDRLSVTYTPANDFAGGEAFQYAVTDGPGSVTASVAVTVLNQAPLPHSDVLAAPEDTWVGYQSYNVLGNDVDPDGDELHIVSVEQPAHGQFLVSPDSQQFSYKSNPDWYGMDSFYYTVSDPFGAQVRVFSQISVAPVNDAPVAHDDSFSVYKNQVLTITQAQVVANDTDIEGNEISVYSVGPATNGATRMLAGGSIEYTPYGEFVGTDSFEYTAQDSGGGAYSTAHIIVNVLQDTRPTADFTFTCNGFTCTFDASPSTDDRGIVSYQWLLNTSASSATPAAGKTFSFTYPSEGSFQVRLTVQDVLGQTAAAIKWVTICAPPGIASQPASQTIFSGYTSTLSVTAGGTGPFSYQWYEGAAGTATTPVGTNNSSYTTPGLTADKTYWVRVTSTCSGSISVNSNAATVTVCQVPGFATQPASKTINSGSAATLTVVASGSGPFSYQWYDADTNTFVGTGSTYTTPALTATKSYWVRVTSTCNGTITATSNIATVTVCDPPVVTTHPAPKLINAGASATLNVAASGSGPFSYQWFEGSSGTTTTPVGTNSDTFTTPPLASTKTYWARVTSTCNGSTSANSNAATVTVCQAPGFATPPASKSIPIGSSTTLTVVASGSGPFSYQWYEGTASSTTMPVGTSSSSFTTPVLTTDKSYWVRVISTCNGTASANSSTATITMACAAPPSISASPTSRTIVAGQSTILSVTASGFGTLTYQWYQGTAPSTTTPVGTNSSSLTVTPGATTNYWVMVSNACGGTASATATVTLCNPPVITTQPASTTVVAGATAALSVVASGTGPFSYQWYDGASGVTTTPVGTNSASFTTPPLAATKSYWVRVSNACSTNSNAATITVNAPPLARRQFAASTANSQLTITTNWTQPTQAGTLLVAIVSAERTWYPIANWQPPAGWQLAASYEMSYIKTSIYYYPNNPGGRTAETFGNGGYYDDMILQLAEYTGVATASPLDKTAFNGDMSNGGYVDTGYTPQTSQPQELVITALTSYSMTDFYSPSQGFIQLDDRNQGFGNLTTAVHERLTTTAGSWGHSASVGAPAQWVGVAATFRASAPN